MRRRSKGLGQRETNRGRGIRLNCDHLISVKYKGVWAGGTLALRSAPSALETHSLWRNPICWLLEN